MSESEKPAVASGPVPHEKRRPVIMVSSTVYGYEELLDRIYAALTEFGYEVWMSHKGTLPTASDKSAFENCILGVERCDLFLGLITPWYGSGIAKGDLSITHKELLRAIELNKPRWLLAHDHVVFARQLIRSMGRSKPEQRAKMRFKKGSQSFNDLRLIDMYEAAILNEVKFQDRKGNWVQTFVNDDDALRYATSQFYRFQEVEEFLKEHLKNRDEVMARVEADKI